MAYPSETLHLNSFFQKANYNFFRVLAHCVPIVWVVDPSSSVTRRLCLFDVGSVATKLLLLFDFVEGASEVVIEAATSAATGEEDEFMETSVVALGEGETDNRLLEVSDSGTGNPETMDWKKYMAIIIVIFHSWLS